MLKILYIGSENSNSTAYHRAKALNRLGNPVKILDVSKNLKKQLSHKIFGFLNYRTGYRFIRRDVETTLYSKLEKNEHYELIWIDSGELFGPEIILALKQKLKCPVILYNIDDPTGKRDGGRFRSLKKALTEYDLVAVVRKETADECINLGAKKVLQVLRSYDEIAHLPFRNIDDIPQEFRSEVAFIGTWMPQENRDVFMLKLIEMGVPLSIWGDAWQKSPNFEKLKNNIRGSAIYGRDYVAAAQGAKICIGMLSKGNRDLHTTRSLEIPFMGGLFCAQRTSDHLDMYKDGVEAVFWDTVEECGQVCLRLLNDNVTRLQIQQAGMKRVREMKAGNEDICKLILDELNSLWKNY